MDEINDTRKPLDINLDDEFDEAWLVDDEPTMRREYTDFELALSRIVG